jgi:hypothetical protein
MSILLGLFDVTSTLKSDKTAYHIVMKQWLRLKGLTWLELPEELIIETIVEEIRNLQDHLALIRQIGEIEQMKSEFEFMVSEYSADRKF